MKDLTVGMACTGLEAAIKATRNWPAGIRCEEYWVSPAGALCPAAAFTLAAFDKSRNSIPRRLPGFSPTKRVTDDFVIALEIMETLCETHMDHEFVWTSLREKGLGMLISDNPQAVIYGFVEALVYLRTLDPNDIYRYEVE